MKKLVNTWSVFWSWFTNTKIPGKHRQAKLFGLFVFGFILFLPTFIAISKFIPANKLPFGLDYLLLALALAMLIYVLIKVVYKLIFTMILAAFLVLFTGTVMGNYGFKQLGEDYTDFIYVVTRSAKPKEIIVSKLTYFPNKNQFAKAIDFKSPKVRAFCINAIREHSAGIEIPKGYKQIAHSLAVFKTINSQWLYVHDPKNREYFATANESIKNLAGDCDDHSILMASCIKMVGGTPRLVLTEGHVYPELFLGAKEQADTAIKMLIYKMFPKESKHKAINFHIDENKNIWLNMDYTSRYPGGKFMNEKILGTYTLY